MFVNIGGGGKKIGPDKQNQQQHQIPAHQYQLYPQEHQLLNQQQTQQQLQSSTSVQHKQTQAQTVINSHPVSHSHTQQRQQQQQQQQTVIIQHQQKSTPSSHQQQYQHHQTSVAYVTYPYSNLHATATKQHGSVQAITCNIRSSQISASPPNLVCGSNDTLSSNRPGRSSSNSLSHYGSQATNSHHMIPAYHLQLQQNASVMVAAQFNNVSEGNAGATQLSNTTNVPAFYQPTHQSQTSTTQQQPGLMSTQQALQYFQNRSLPIHQLQHHLPQQMRNMITMVAQPRQQYLISPNYFTLSHATLPQPFTNAPQRSAAQGVGSIAASSTPAPTQILNVAERSTIVAGPTTYVPAPYCTPPLQLSGTQTALNMATVGVVGNTPSSSLSGVEYTKPRKHAIPIIDPITGEQVTVEPKKETNVVAKLNTFSKPLEVTTQCEEQISSPEKNVESVSVQTENEKSLTVSVASGCSEVMITTSSSDTDEDDENIQTTVTDKNDQQTEIKSIDIDREIINSTDLDKNDDQLKAEVVIEEQANITNVLSIPENNTAIIATTATSISIQSGDSNTDSLKICIYEDSNDTDADASEQVLDQEDDVILNIEYSKEKDVKRLNSKKSCKKSKKNKNKSRQQHQKSQEANNKVTKTCRINNDNNTETILTDKITTTATNNKGQSKKLPEKNDNSPGSGEINTSTSFIEDKSQKQHFSSAKTLTTKIEIKKPLQNKNRPHFQKSANKDRRIRYTLEELKAISKSEESNKTPIVPCKKGGCISQLFVTRQQQQHCHNSHSLSNSSSQNNVQLIRINLSLTEEIKLSRCENAWQPKVLSRKPEQENEYSSNSEQELKKVRGILNKLTSDNFQVLVKSMKDICLDSKENIEKVMLLIFEKTVSEPNFAPIYAKFCNVLFQEIKPEIKKLFNTLLIQRLQMEFENNVNNPNAKDSTLQHIIDKLNETMDQKEKIELSNEYDIEEYKFRRRAWGTVKFIGEMYKLNCLTSDRVLQCIESLLNNGNEEKLEYLCKLLTTVGLFLERSETEERLNNIFRKIRNIVRDAKSRSTKQKLKISSRVRFMLLNIIDLRKRNWDLKPNNAAVPIVSRLQQQTNNLSTSNNSNLNIYERANQRMGYGNNHRQNRNTMHNIKETGGDSFVQKGIDIKKLNFSRGANEPSLTNTKLGNSSAYLWRNESQQNTPSTCLEISGNTQKQQTLIYKQHKQQQNQKQQHSQYSAKSQSPNSDIKSILDSYSVKDNQTLLNHLIEEYLDCIPSRSRRWQVEIYKSWQKTTENQEICLVYYILMEYLHLSNVKQLERNACSNIFIYLMSYGAFKKKTFARAYKQFGEEISDLLMDVPNGWSYIFEFLGPLLHERLLSFDDIWLTIWQNDRVFTERFVKALVLYFTREFGANYMRELWHNEFKLDLGNKFTNDPEFWEQFVVTNNFQFIYDQKVKPEIDTLNATSCSVEQRVQRLEIFLNSNNSNLALDYISTNVNINSKFIKHLIRFLCCDYATKVEDIISTSIKNKNSSTCSTKSVSKSDLEIKTPQINVKLFRKICFPLLRLCLDAHEDHEMICLDSIVEAMQQEYNVNTASILICNIFDLLYDGEVISRDTFEKWHRQWQQQQYTDTTNTKNQRELLLNAQLQAFMQRIL